MEKIQLIIGISNGIFGIDVTKRTRKREYAEARFLVFKICFDEVKSLSRIAEFFGITHSSVIHGINRYNDFLKNDDYYTEKYLRIKKELNPDIEIPKNENNKTVKYLLYNVERLKMQKEDLKKQNEKLKEENKRLSSNRKKSYKEIDQLLNLDEKTIKLFIDTRLNPFFKMLEYEKAKHNDRTRGQRLSTV